MSDGAGYSVSNLVAQCRGYPGCVSAVTNVVLVLVDLCHKTLLPLIRAQSKLALFPCTAVTLAGCSVNLSSGVTRKGI